MVQFRLICNDAGGDNGYAQNDEIIIPPGYSGDRDNNRVNSVYVDATNVYVRFAAVTSCFYYGNKATGALSGLDDAKWDLYVEAAR